MEVPQSAEERRVVRSGLLRRAKAAGAAGRTVEVERLMLEHIHFSTRCQLQDAREVHNTPSYELASLQEAVRSTGAGLKTLAAAAAAAGERGVRSSRASL